MQQKKGLRVEAVAAHILPSGAVIRVCAGFGCDVDHPAERSAVFESLCELILNS